MIKRSPALYTTITKIGRIPSYNVSHRFAHPPASSDHTERMSISPAMSSIHRHHQPSKRQNAVTGLPISEQTKHHTRRLLSATRKFSLQKTPQDDTKQHNKEGFFNAQPLVQRTSPLATPQATALPRPHLQRTNARNPRSTHHPHPRTTPPTPPHKPHNQPTKNKRLPPSPTPALHSHAPQHHAPCHQRVVSHDPLQCGL